MLRRKKHKTCAGNTRRQRRGLLNQGGQTVYFPKVVTSEMRKRQPAMRGSAGKLFCNKMARELIKAAEAG